MGLKHKIGIIGFGGMANHHFNRIQNQNYERATVKGIYDVDKSVLEKVPNLGVKAYNSLDEILADPEIDLILIATTNEAHKYIAIKALRAGKNVLCEKPVTINSEDLLEVMDVAKETGKVFTIDQNRRTNLDFVTARRSIESGLIGKPLIIESRVEGSRGMPSGWRTKKELGGGMMLDWGVHLIDQIMYMVHETVTQVYCKMLSIQYSEVEDNFHLMMTFESGLIAIVEVGTNNYITHPRWYVMGEKGTALVEDWACKGKLVYNIEKEDKWDEQIFYTMAGPTKTMAPRTKNSTKTVNLQAPTDVTDDIAKVYDQFIDAVEGKAELTIKPEQAQRVMKVMEAAFESDKLHKSIDVEI